MNQPEPHNPTPYYPKWQNTQTTPTPVHYTWPETPKTQKTTNTIPKTNQPLPKPEPPQTK